MEEYLKNNDNLVIFSSTSSSTIKCLEKIDGAPKPDIPMLMFVSDGKETGIEKWSEIQKEYASELSNATVVELEC